jgi:hypothetical protein
MKQSRFMSGLETLLSTATGFLLSLFVQWLVLPILLGVNIPLEMNFAFAAIMTVVSLLRQFVMRRVFEALHIRVPMSPAVVAIAAERRRQVDVEGWDAAHDDEHTDRSLALVAALYATPIKLLNFAGNDPWPWRYVDDDLQSRTPPSNCWDKRNKHDERRRLVISGALVVAELERLDRARKAKPGLRIPVSTAIAALARKSKRRAF